jgi:hypothetical protein
MKTGAKDRLPIWAAGLSLMLAGSVEASSGTFQAFGYVHDNLGNPVVNIDVTGDDYVGDLYTFKTDATGYYSVDFDSDGNYKLYVSCPQSTARGYACLNPVAISIADGAINVDFVVQPAPLQVTNTTLPKGNVGSAYHSQLAAVGGQSPYSWQLAADSGSLPDGLALNSSGLISGAPTVAVRSSVKVQVTDANSAITNKALSIIVNPQPSLTPILWATNRFSMLLTGGSNQNYTLQTSTNLSLTNWTSLFVTSNRVANSFTVTDTNATNIQRMYRVLVGP